MLKLEFKINKSLTEVFLDMVGEVYSVKYANFSLVDLADKFVSRNPLLYVDDEGFFSYGAYSFHKAQFFNYTCGSLCFAESRTTIDEILNCKSQVESLFGGSIVGGIVVSVEE